MSNTATRQLSDGPATLGPALAATSRDRWADFLRGDQAQRWEDGAALLVEEYLAALPILETADDVVLDLIYNEVLLREQNGERVRLEEFQARFPTHHDALARQFEIHEALGRDLGNTSVTRIETSGRHSSQRSDPRAESLPPVAAKPPAGRTPSQPRATGGLAPSHLEDHAPPAQDDSEIPGFEILEELGRGGCGVVYKAKQTELNRLVAIKMLHGRGELSPIDLERFHLEAELIARLQHPNIVQVFQVGSRAGHPYLVLEYVAGGSLEAWLNGTPWPTHAAASLIETLARTLAAVHACGIIHRDLKPANILLCPKSENQNPQPQADAGSDIGRRISDFEPKITDFGLAKARDGAAASAQLETQPGMVVGTPQYMAPEQAFGLREKIGSATDVHALGVILYELLTGRLPYSGANTVEVLAHIAFETTRPPSSLVSGLDADLEAICLKCLQKETVARYGSAAELADDLHRYLAGEPVAARRIGNVVRLRKWVRRRPLIAGLAAAVFLSLAAGLAAVTWQWQKAVSARTDAEQAAQNAINAEVRTQTALLIALDAEKRSQASLRDEAAAHSQAENARQDLERKQRELTGKQQELTAALHTAERLVGRTSLALAVPALSERRLADAEAILDECPAALRNWEWRYLKHQCHVRLLTLVGHQDGTGFHGPVMAVAVAPDGKRLATVTSAGHAKAAPDLRLWDGATGKLVRTLDGRDHVAFSPRGDWLASVGPKGEIRLWPLDRNGDPGEPRIFEQTKSVRALAFSADGQYLAVAPSDGGALVWPINQKSPSPFRLKDAEHTLPVRALAFSPDSRILAMEGPVAVRLWDVVLRKQLTHSGEDTPKGKTPKPLVLSHPAGAFVTALAFGPKGQLATGVGDGPVRVWDWKTGTVSFTLEGPIGGIEALAFSRDGQRLGSVCQDGTVRVWDVNSRKQLAQLPGTRALAFDPTGERLLVPRRAGGSIAVWAIEPPQLLRPIEHSASVQAVAFSADGRMVASAGQGHEIRLTDPATSKDVRAALKVDRQVLALAFRPGGAALVAGLGKREPDGAGEVRVWNLKTGKETSLTGHSGSVLAVAWSRDGSRLASAGNGGIVRLWDGETLQLLQTLNAEGAVNGLAFSPDGKQLAVAPHSSRVQLWDVALAKRLRTLPTTSGFQNGLAWSPDGRQLAAPLRNGNVALWDLALGQDWQVLTGHSASVSAVAFTPDSRRLASAAGDGTIRLWDPQEEEEVLVIRGPTQPINGIAFSPDGLYLAAAGKDHKVLLYAAPGEPR